MSDHLKRRSMQIKYAIMSSDSNSLYLDFWRYTSRIWKEKFAIEPILIYIDETDSNIDETYGKVYKMRPVENYPTYIQTLFVRFWFPIHFLDEVSIITDIDMFPMSKFYFLDQIRTIENDKYVHINPCIESYGMIPTCYHIATGKTYKDVLEMPDPFSSALKMLDQYKNNRFKDKEYWFTDEMFSTDKINKCKNRVVLIPREGGQNGHRIDRIAWQYDEDLIKNEYYYDSHCIRPVKNNKEVEKLFTLILGH